MIVLDHMEACTACDRGRVTTVPSPVLARAPSGRVYAFVLPVTAAAGVCPVCNGRGVVEVVEGPCPWRKSRRPVKITADDAWSFLEAVPRFQRFLDQQ